MEIHQNKMLNPCKTSNFNKAFIFFCSKQNKNPFRSASKYIWDDWRENYNPQYFQQSTFPRTFVYTNLTV